jgi:hypothetical protein
MAMPNWKFVAEDTIIDILDVDPKSNPAQPGREIRYVHHGDVQQ